MQWVLWRSKRKARFGAASWDRLELRISARYRFRLLPSARLFQCLGLQATLDPEIGPWTRGGVHHCSAFCEDLARQRAPIVFACHREPVSASVSDDHALSWVTER